MDGQQTTLSIDNVQHAFSNISISGDNANVHLGDTYITKADGIRASDIEQYKQLLHFSEIWQRYMNIADNESGTCKWLLQDSTDHDTSLVDSNNTDIDVVSDSETTDDDSDDDIDPMSDIGFNIGDVPEMKWDSFLAWLEAGGKIYWISGKAGSGKSTLMKYLCETISSGHINASRWKNTISYWFWEAGSELQKTLRGCLQSLILQLLTQPATQPITWQEISGKQLIFSCKAMLKFLQAILTKLNHEGIDVLLLIDGLDEAGGDIDHLSKFLRKQARNSSHLRVCISSRPEQLFVDMFASCPQLRLQDLNHNDINRYIMAKFLRNPRVKGVLLSREALARTLLVSLQEKAQGVFLWVRLAINSLLRGLQNKDDHNLLEQRVSDLPRELNDLYDAMLLRGNADDKFYAREAALYFKLILERKMTFFEFCLAINDDSRKRLLLAPLNWTATNIERQLQCDQVETWINVRAAGLLEVQDDREDGQLFNPLFDYRDVFTPATYRYHKKIVDFAHRTARTYLVDSTQSVERLKACQISNQDLRDLIFESWLVNLYVINCPTGAYLGLWRTGGDDTSPAEPPVPTRALFEVACDLWNRLHHAGQFKGTRQVFWQSKREGSNFQYIRSFPVNPKNGVDALMLCCKAAWFGLAFELLQNWGSILPTTYTTELLHASIFEVEKMHDGMGLNRSDTTELAFLDALLERGADLTLLLPDLEQYYAPEETNLAIDILQENLGLATNGFTLEPKRSECTWLSRQWLKAAATRDFVSYLDACLQRQYIIFTEFWTGFDGVVLYGDFALSEIVPFSYLLSMAAKEIGFKQKSSNSSRSRVRLLYDCERGDLYGISEQNSSSMLEFIHGSDRSGWGDLIFLKDGPLAILDCRTALEPMLDAILPVCTQLNNGAEAFRFLGKNDAWIREYTARVFDPDENFKLYVYGPNRSRFWDRISRAFQKLQNTRRLPSTLNNSIEKLRQQLLKDPSCIYAYLQSTKNSVDPGSDQQITNSTDVNGLELYYYLWQHRYLD